MYKYYLFDLDRTLWSFDKNAKRAIFGLIDEYSLFSMFGFDDKELFFDRYDKINHRLWAKYEAGELTKEELRRLRFHKVFEEYLKEKDNSCNFTEKALEELSTEFGEAYLTRMTYETELEPNAAEVLAGIKLKGGKISIISNGFKEVQHRKLSNSGIMQYVDAVITSEETGIHKPSPVIFRKALEAIATKEQYDNNRRYVKKVTLMVGDDFANDIEGAQIFGIDQFYYNPNHTPCEGLPTYESDNLSDILTTSTAATLRLSGC